MDSSEPGAPDPDTGFFASVRRMGLQRSDDRWVGGVCGGIARRTDLDPLLVRGLAAVLVLLGGIGLIAYGLAWAFLPDERDQGILVERAVRGNLDLPLVGASAMVLVGFARGDRWLWADDIPRPVQALGWLFVIGAIVVAVARMRRSPAPPAPPTPYGPFPAAQTQWRQPMNPHEPGAQKAGGASWQPEPTPGPSYSPPQPTAPHVYAAQLKVQPPPARRGPGRTASGIVWALLLLAMAGAMLVQRLGWSAPVPLIWAGAALIILGAAVAVGGLLGRTPGWFGAVSIIILLIAVPASFADGDWHTASTGNGTQTIVLSDIGSATKGVSVNAGDVTVDLRSLDPAGQTVQVPVDLNAGEIRILLPPDVGVHADVSVGLGNADWHVGGHNESIEGIGQEHSFSSSGQGGTIDLSVQVGAGDVQITQEES